MDDYALLDSSRSGMSSMTQRLATLYNKHPLSPSDEGKASHLCRAIIREFTRFLTTTLSAVGLVPWHPLVYNSSRPLNSVRCHERAVSDSRKRSPYLKRKPSCSVLHSRSPPAQKPRPDCSQQRTHSNIHSFASRRPLRISNVSASARRDGRTPRGAGAGQTRCSP